MDKIVNIEETFKDFFPNFNPKEFECPCGCENIIQTRFMTALQAMREAVDVPFIINSGYRCKEYNSKLPGSSKESQHIKGLAADIAINHLTGVQKRKLIRHALIRFNGVGIYKNFIHVDLRAGERVVWTG